MDAARAMTCAALDQGERPSVVSAIVKYHAPSACAWCVNDGMDILGGSGICIGPRNLLGRGYQAAADRHHGGRRQHPHPHPDHLRPGRDPLPSLSC